eukprot:133825_1
MCFPKRKMPTNQQGQATRLWLCHCQSLQIRTFHITWFTFWLCFLGWFATANLFPQISADLKLTPVHKAIAGGCSVASTVIFRVITGVLCDSLGPRKSYPCLLIITAFPIAGMALVTGPIGYIIVSLFIGIAGASFVITQYHTTSMFAGKTVGTANATSAGWGNFGGGCANFFMPYLYQHFRDAYGVDNSTAWRLCMVVPAVTYLVMAFVYYTFTQDRPPLPASQRKNDPQLDVTANKKGNDVDGSVFKIGAGDYRTWILFLVYAACFGIELTVLRFAVGYLTGAQFALKQSMAGFIILLFSLCNLFARSIGGVIADIVSRFSKESLHGRVYSLFIILLVESVFLILFAFGAHETWINSLPYTIVMLIMFSLCVQAAEGATFAIVPFVQPKAIGPVAGIVGAGGNMGAMLFAFCIFTSVPISISWFTAWLILGIFVFCVSFATLGIRFSEEEIRSADEAMNTWTEMEKPQPDATQDGNDKSAPLEMHMHVASVSPKTSTGDENAMRKV